MRDRWQNALALNGIEPRLAKRFLQVNTDAASDEVRRWIQSKGLITYGPGWAKLRRTTDAVI
ncbi:hypothetical protein E0H56_32420 [Rhizobium leguminosarum bv. viciae]|uniref:Uncharacterized protein n=1 Tax=Rhizobium leguminosarum TaxID=384 RepID=A0A2K9ZD97_RHILE|nr:hypothetical protein CUJ84_pRLN1000550 [Rhizobium leguminosarum]NKJ94546.1 hypothetical protein [Rhizobium leguminosarum bv. viciae]TBZ83016.1 hypothetical protein E0H56_32420 [Rhizobium leguminosarum bv. viciae]